MKTERTITIKVLTSHELTEDQVNEEILKAETRMNTESKLRFHLIEQEQNTNTGSGVEKDQIRTPVKGGSARVDKDCSDETIQAVKKMAEKAFQSSPKAQVKQTNTKTAEKMLTPFEFYHNPDLNKISAKHFSGTSEMKFKNKDLFDFVYNYANYFKQHVNSKQIVSEQIFSEKLQEEFRGMEEDNPALRTMFGVGFTKCFEWITTFPTQQIVSSEDINRLLETLINIEGNEYRIHFHNGEWWLEHKGVGSGELLKDWIMEALPGASHTDTCACGNVKPVVDLNCYKCWEQNKTN